MKQDITDGQTVLTDAIIRGNADLVLSLLTSGVDPDEPNRFGVIPLAVAAEKFDFEIAELLLNYGADPELANEWGQKPLFITCQCGFGELPDSNNARKRLIIAELLLKHDAEVDATDEQGWTPLRQALMAANDIKLVRLLLQHRADPGKADNSGITPLQLAEKFCSAEMADLLREHTQ